LSGISEAEQKMKAFALVFALLALTLQSNGAWALECGVSVAPPEPIQKMDPQRRQQIEAQMRERFDAQTRAQFGAAQIVAEAKVMSLGETGRMTWDSSQLVEVAVTRYLRTPSTKQIQDRYFITAVPDALRINDSILFFARAEPEATWQARKVARDPELVRPTGEIPATWTQRIWYAQEPCTNPVYQLAAPENSYLVRFARQLADDKLAPATLTISFALAGAPAKESAEIPLKIEAIASSQVAQSAVAQASAKPSRTVTVTSSGNPISIDLPAGRYRLLWPELPGYQPACFTEYGKRNCALDLVPGASARAHMRYQPTAKITLVPVTSAGTPINLLGELEWLRIDAPKPNLAEPNQAASQHSNIDVDELDELDERYGSEIVPGRYQLHWLVKSYAPPMWPYNITCELLRTEKIPVRWRIGAGALASEHEIPVGHSVILAEIPESSWVKLEFTHAQKNDGEVKVSPRCVDMGYSVSTSSSRQLKVAAFRGQQYQLEYGCYSCKPRIETVRKLMQADQDMVLELK